MYKTKHCHIIQVFSPRTCDGPFAITPESIEIAKSTYPRIQSFREEKFYFYPAENQVEAPHCVW